MNSNKKKRIETVLSGKVPDRIPVSIWGHDFLREWSAKDLADQTVEKQQQFGYDFVKLNPRWTFFGEIWGCTYQPPTEQAFPAVLHRIIEQADDFYKVEQAETSNPVFQEHLQALELVIEKIGDDVDVIYTLFSPLAVAGLLCGVVGEPLKTMAGQNPKAVHYALEVITESLKLHISDVLNTGASGLFYAPLPWTSTDICDPAFYSEFGTPYDLSVLASAKQAPFNMLHVCGNHIELERFYSYPVHVLNWDNFGEGNPSLSQVHADSDKVVAGGIPHRTLHEMSFDEIKNEAETSIGGIKDRIMLAGGCAVYPTLSSGIRRHVREIAETMRFD